MEKFKLSDSVVARIAQLLQEAILFGIDITDLMREIELVKSSMPGEEDTLVMSPEYAQRVVDNIRKALDRVDELKSDQDMAVMDTPKIIVS